MDHPRSNAGTGEDNAEIPDDLRCKRSDGKQWRCTARSMPDKTVCEKHYIQAKKRAANSALRASLKKAKKRPLGESEIYLESKSDEFDVPLANAKAADFSHPVSGKKNKEKVLKSQVRYSPETTPVRGLSVRNLVKQNDDFQRDAVQFEESWKPYKTSPLSAMESSRSKPQRSFDTSGIMEYSDQNSDSSDDTGGQTCHQCRRNERVFIWCQKCDRRGYCGSCVSTWYSDIPLEDFQNACPACRGTCNCRVCLRGDNLIRARIREIPVLEKLQYLYCLLSSVLPVIKQIHHEQISEFQLEKRLYGTEIDLARTKLNADEQMCCNLCRIPIIDYHRHCTTCSYDLCLSCCQDLREVSANAASGREDRHQFGGRRQDKGIISEMVAGRKPRFNISDKLPKWKAASDGSILCPPKEYGGCGYSSLTLSRIFKLNWVAKLVKNVEEMVSGCKVNVDGNQEKPRLNDNRFYQCAHRADSDDNFLYCPVAEDIKREGINDFKKHWVRGEPVIVKEVIDRSSISEWDPTIIRRGICETTDEKMKDENRVVKAIDCLNWSEVNIKLSEFVKGYCEGCTSGEGHIKMLKLKDWPSPSASEEFLVYQRPEFISKVPLLEYIHSKWGLLNVAAKLPHYSLQNDVGPKIFISHGTYEELERGNSVTNLHFKMRDMVYMLVHTCEVNLKGLERMRTEERKGSLMESEVEASAGRMNDQGVEATAMAEVSTSSQEPFRPNGEFSGKTYPGALWDVFRRQDVPKLVDYLQLHWKEFGKPDCVLQDIVNHCLYDESLYLTKPHIRKLKEEFGVEPWSFEQQLGQAVFIPTGCPFQMRNLQSTVQLGLDFLSPESLGEAVKMAEEIRCLPNNHEAKFQVVEVGKMSLYAASSAIKEVQKLVLDSKFAELGFEDPNLTAKVSENLEKMNKRGETTCA